MPAEKYLPDVVGQLFHTNVEFLQGDLPVCVFALEGVNTGGSCREL